MSQLSNVYNGDMVDYMKKTGRNIIIAVLAIVVLAGGLFAITQIEPAPVEKDETSKVESATEESIVIFERDEADAVSASIKNPNGEMEIAISSTQETVGEEKVTKYIYTLVGYENYNASTGISSSLKTLYNLEAKKDVGEATSDLSVYGLDEDTCATVVVNFKDGSKDEIKIGNDSPESFGKYILVDNHIYIAGMSVTFFETVNDNVDLYGFDETLVNKETGEPAPATFGYLNFSGTNFPQEVKIVYNEDKAKYLITEPFTNVMAHLTLMDTFSSSLSSFSTTGIALLNATEEDLADYGLAEPMATLDFEVNEIAHKISVSEKVVDGNRYVMVDDIKDIIYTAPAASVDFWADIDLYDLRLSYVMIPSVMDTEVLEVTIDGEKSVIDFTRTEKEKTDETAETTYSYTTKMDDKDVEYKDVTTFYLPMISIAVLNLDELDHASEPAVVITHEYYDGSADTVEYFKANDKDRYVAYINGEYSATTRSTSIEDLIEAFDVLKSTIK